MPTFERMGATALRVRAFTLIEVLAALVIVSLGMMAVIQAVSQAASNGAYLRDKTVAHWVAMNQLTLMRLAPTPPARGKSSGEVEMAGQRWRWLAEVSETPVPSVKRIEIGVRFAAADEEMQLAHVTGFYGEKIAKPGAITVSYSPTAAQQPPTASPR